MDLPSMFEQARSLVAGAKIIIDSEGINDNAQVRHPTTPVIVSCALSTEVGLKLIIAAESEKKAKGHDLESLFNQLSKQTAKEIVAHYLNLNHEETEESLKEKIERHKRIFIDWRYAYESESSIECSPTFLYQWAYALNTFIEQKFEFERNGNGWLIEKSS